MEPVQLIPSGPLPRAVAVEPCGGFRLYLRYDDGVEGVVDLSGLVRAKPALAPLRDGAFFAKAAVVDNGAAIGWPGDLAIDAIAQRSRLTAEGDVPIAAEQLEAAGVALFGRNWKTELAEVLGLRDPARLRAMMRGDRPIPPGFGREIAALLRARQRHIGDVLSVLGDPSARADPGR